MVKITKHHMEKFYKQLTFGNSSQRKEFIGDRKMKKTKMYSADEVAEMMELVYLVELEYFIMWSSIEERFETTDKIYQKLEEVYESEIGEQFGYRQEFYQSEVALTIAENVLFDEDIDYSSKKRNFVKV